MKASRGRRVLVRVSGALLGIVVAVGIAEVAFRVRDHGTFPQLNMFVADPALGVRLAPGATENVRFGGPKNPATSVRIGTHGYRGDAPPAPVENDDEILVVGDSQVFGLGVEEDQTFSRELQRVLGHGRVVNLGVPTYGPAEYTSVVEEALRTRHPRAIVYTVNLVNDLFELARPNRERHRVLDGWAVRAEQVPGAPFAFPGRTSLLGGSHLVYAFRRWQHDNPLGTPSEGTYAELLAPKAEPLAAAPGVLDEQLATANATFTKAKADLDELVRARVECKDEDGGFDCNDIVGAKANSKLELYAGGEGSRAVIVTVDNLKKAALLRAYDDGNHDAIAELEKDPAVHTAAEARRAALATLQGLVRLDPTFHPKPTPLTPEIAKVAALAKAHGARLITLVLPVDVMVSKDEWSKYGQDPKTAPDLSAAAAFGNAVVESARDVGAEGLDTTALLRAAEPGAFLDGDIHMTPKGHTAVATALAALLAQPAELVRARAGLPAGRTWPDGMLRWSIEGLDAIEYGDGSEHRSYTCPVRKHDEWLSFACDRMGESGRSLFGTTLPKNEEIVAIHVRSGGLGEVLNDYVDGRWRVFAAPVLADAPLDVEIRSSRVRGRLLHAERDAAGEITTTLGEPIDMPDLEPQQPPAPGRNDGCYREGGPVGPFDADCSRTYSTNRCDLSAACMRASVDAPPECEPGFVAVGAVQRCKPRCGPTSAACTQGTTCHEWQGVHACW